MLVMLVSLFVCEPEYIRSKNCNVAIPLDKPRGAFGKNNDKYVYNKKKKTNKNNGDIGTKLHMPVM